MFADRATILIRSGKGGDGHVSFRREKYVPDGGPDGGNGGKGGDVIFVVDSGMNTLYDYKHKHKFSAQDGAEGGKRKCSGANGQDIILKVPKGTVIREKKSGKIMADMSGDNVRQTVLFGGRGGKGNMNFATSRMQAPRYAKPGEPSMELEVVLELKMAADVGLVGLPNAGKSTFLSRVSNARPKIADYPFTTIVPNLGVVKLDFDADFVIADIPGLIEGAADGLGLGHEFLRHIERTRVLLHLVDVSEIEGNDPVQSIKVINNELNKYGSGISDKPMVIAANKTDTLPDDGEEIIEVLKKNFPDAEIFGISAVTGRGVREVLFRVHEILKTLPKDPIVYEQEFFPEDIIIEDDLGYTIEVRDEGETRTFVVEGPSIERMLNYTNLQSEKGFAYFQVYLKRKGIIDELRKMDAEDGDTVKMYGHEFDYYEENFDDE
ncbi:MAG: GTPase ObgE [Lachnospiraceae bacterium]|jgi:GTP-binding protein